MPVAVHFGAGRIGRGFLGQLLHDGGYLTTFIDADSALTQALNARHEYPLHIVSEETTEKLTIDGVQALNSIHDREKIIEAIAQADLISTAVGVNILPRIAPTLAAGIAARAKSGMGPVDILLCENQWHASDMMRSFLQPEIDFEIQDYFLQRVGLVETVIGRMVPSPAPEYSAADSLLMVAEPYGELPIARVQLRNTPPTLPGLILAEDFEAYEARKLFLHNAAHAALAYLGAPRGFEFIWQCAADPEIRAVCEGALAESAAALVQEYHFLPDDLQAFNSDLLRRFANKALGDTVARVAADPIRKLRPEDRLIGAALLCLKHNIVPTHLVRVAAAAFQYALPSDPAAQELQAMRRERGDATTLHAVSGVLPESSLAQLILESLYSR